jgi:hypothetical protein
MTARRTTSTLISDDVTSSRQQDTGSNSRLDGETNDGDGIAVDKANRIGEDNPRQGLLKRLSIPRVYLEPDIYLEPDVYLEPDNEDNGEGDELKLTMMSGGVRTDVTSDTGTRRCNVAIPNSRTMAEVVMATKNAAMSTSGGGCGGSACVSLEIVDHRTIPTTGGGFRVGAHHRTRPSTASTDNGIGGESILVPTTKSTTSGLRQWLLGRSTSSSQRAGSGGASTKRRRDARYRRCQALLHNFLERPKNWRSILYHLLV